MAGTTATGPDAAFDFSPLAQGYWRLADWQLSPRQRLDFLHRHLALGITTVDHADIYGDYRCEALFGEALRLDPAIRERLQVVTKCGIMLRSGQFPHRTVKHYDTGAAHVEASVENSLRRLGTDRIDLLLIHRPDPLLDADELAAAFTRLHQAGKVLQFGVSNFSPAQFDLLQSRLEWPLVTNQVEINPLRHRVVHDGTLDQLQQLGARPMAWSCLAGGELLRADAGPAQRARDALEGVAAALGGDVTADQVAYAWVMRLPSRPVPILGTGKIDRVRRAWQAIDLALDREQWFGVLEAARGEAVP